MAFHMNGTVFAVVMRYTYQSVAEKQSGELLDFLDNSIEFGDHRIEMEYILSHYISDGNETTSTDIYEIMEYSIAKGYGMKQKYIRCDQDICKEIERRRYLREKLKKIDSTHGFEVWYQPIKCIKTEKFSTMEALIRLRERDGSLISPAEFIPIAESTGQINSITWFVLEQTCKALKNNSELEGTSVSINLPMSQLMEKGFATRFTGIVDQAGIDHERICLEFTERTIQDNFIQTKNIMQEMTENGFTFYLDDFGQGYSNFNCMLQLPFKVIKFDSCLIHKNEKGEYNFGTIQALTKIFHEMDLTVVAEGAEKIEEVSELIRVGVDRIQGYVYSKPLTEVELVKFYKKLS
ncbi:MAG: EAL domain-containing protein [Clostridia bacterium]|nr:EAL domain-containing protein [Clostridia bacterium]